MRRFLGMAVGLALGLLLGWIMSMMGCFHTPWSCDPKEVNVLQDSTYVYHLAPNQKTVHLSLSNHGIIAWSFDSDSTVDSVAAVFSPASPFASPHFEFSDSVAFSGPPIVSADTTVYHYTITVYPHSHAPVTVDPGIIIDM